MGWSWHVVAGLTILAPRNRFVPLRAEHLAVIARLARVDWVDPVGLRRKLEVSGIKLLALKSARPCPGLTPGAVAGVAEPGRAAVGRPPRCPALADAGESQGDEALARRLKPDGYRARPEQVVLFTVTAWDVNCPQHIPQRFEAADVEAAIKSRDERIAALEAEVERLRKPGTNMAL